MTHTARCCRHIRHATSCPQRRAREGGEAQPPQPERAASADDQELQGTPLYLAAKLGLPAESLELSMALLERGANPNATNKKGNTLMHTTKWPELMTALLSRNLDPNAAGCVLGPHCDAAPA